MPTEAVGYERRSDGGGSAVAPVMASPDAFGAGIGAAAAQLGGTLHRGELAHYQIERQQQQDQQASDFAAKFAALRQASDQASIDARANAVPGASGHAKAMADWLQQQRDGLTQGITEDAVRHHAEQQLDNFGASFNGREYEWQQATAAGKLVTDTQAMIDTSANRIRTLTDATTYGQELHAGLASIEAMQGVPADVRDKLHRQFEQTATIAHLNGMTDRGQVAPAKALVDSGAFNAILTPEQLEQARNGIEVEDRRQQAQVAHQLALQKAAVTEQTATINARLEAGDVPTDAELARAGADAASIGDKSGAYKLDVARAQAGLNRATQPWTPAQYTQAIDDLEAKGAKRTPAENVTLAQLKHIAPGRVEAFNRDPGSWAALNGHPRPTLDLSDPASIAATVSWRETVARQAGRAPALLGDAQARDLAQLASGSPTERLQAIGQIAALGGRNAEIAAKQIAPGDALLARLTKLRPEDRPAAINGGAARKAHPQLVDGPAGEPARKAFDRFAGGSLALMGQDDVGAAFETSRNIFADGAVKAGQTIAGNGDDAKLVAAAQRALGASRDAQGRPIGGIGEYNGAKVLLPPRLSQQDFDRTLAGMSWTAATPMAPHWTHGAVMTPAEVRRFTPVARPDGTYEFHNARGEVITGKNGNIWRLDVAKTAGAR